MMFFGVESSTIYIVLIVVLVWTFLATCSVITERKIIATRMIKFQHNCNMFQQRENDYQSQWLGSLIFVQCYAIPRRVL